ncbi:hypothetical protein Lser_V15G20266 [Lactuca serriola]
MAAFCPIGAFCSSSNSVNSVFINPKPYRRAIPHKTSLLTNATSPSSTSYNNPQKTNQESMSIDALKRFIRLNLGNWTGSFHQFDSTGKLMHKVDTRLSAGSYGEDELISLIQTLYIKQSSSSSYSASKTDHEAEWAEYKIKETNMFTAEKYQQIGFFPQEKAFALRYQTAGMLETVLREGVLGEDDIGEASPKNLKLPSKLPSIVCENCLYSLDKDLRARAFHIMDPKGIVEMLILFLEQKGVGVVTPPFLDDSKEKENRINQHLGTWKGHSVTKRSGVYGATDAEADTVTSLEIDDKGQLIQDQTSTYKDKNVSTNVRWTGKMSGNLVKYDGGYQITLLPGGMYMGCPCDVGKQVGEAKSFHLEFCWVEPKSPTKRQRLVRTYDIDGLAVSSTYFLETKM